MSELDTAGDVKPVAEGPRLPVPSQENGALGHRAGHTPRTNGHNESPARQLTGRAGPGRHALSRARFDAETVELRAVPAPAPARAPTGPERAPHPAPSPDVGLDAQSPPRDVRAARQSSPVDRAGRDGRQGTARPDTTARPDATDPPAGTDRPDEIPTVASRPAPGDAAAEVWALVERAQAGEADAFGLLYDRYVDTVFRFIYFRVGSRTLAEDLTADTFLRALKRISSFTWQGRDLGAWLVTIARNLVADHFKSGRYRLEVSTGDVLDAEQADRTMEGSPEVAVVDHITNVTLLRAVQQLNREQQECILLRFMHGFSVAETAQTMGKNEGAIKALQYRAVRALHRLLPDGFQP